jgi:hypothetical protein
MQGINIEFEWVRFADYRIELRPAAPELTRGSLFADARAKLLVALGPPEAALKTKPLELFPDLYLELAKATPTEEGHKEFANKYGLLTDPYEDHTYEWPRLVANMQSIVAMVANRKDWPIKDGRYAPYDLPMKLALLLRPNINSSTGMSISIVPTNLYQALILQCVSNCANGAEVRSCRACGTLFEIGRPSGHRSNRAFCSDRCRFEFNHRNRGKEQ